MASINIKIGELNATTGKPCQINGKVVSKSDVIHGATPSGRTWRKFDLVLADGPSSSIECVAWDKACDVLFPLLQLGQEYSIVRFDIKQPRLLVMNGSTTVTPIVVAQFDDIQPLATQTKAVPTKPSWRPTEQQERAFKESQAASAADLARMLAQLTGDPYPHNNPFFANPATCTLEQLEEDHARISSKLFHLEFTMSRSDREHGQRRLADIAAEMSKRKCELAQQH